MFCLEDHEDHVCMYLSSLKSLFFLWFSYSRSRKQTLISVLSSGAIIGSRELEILFALFEVCSTLEKV